MDLELMRKRIVEARLFIGCNRKEFAERLGMPYRTVTNYENGAREPGHDYITKVADLCGCTTDWLLGVSDDPRNDAASRNALTERLLAACKPLNQYAIDKVIAYAQDLAFNPSNLT